MYSRRTCTYGKQRKTFYFYLWALSLRVSSFHNENPHVPTLEPVDLDPEIGNVDKAKHPLGPCIRDLTGYCCEALGYRHANHPRPRGQLTISSGPRERWRFLLIPYFVTRRLHIFTSDYPVPGVHKAVQHQCLAIEWNMFYLYIVLASPLTQ